MSHRLLALAAAGTLAVWSAASAADAAGASGNNGTGASVVNKTAPLPGANIALAVPFKGVAKSFKTGAERKSLLVESPAGEWFTLTFAKECKALGNAKSVKLSQGAKTSRVYVGRRYCQIVGIAAAPKAP